MNSHAIDLNHLAAFVAAYDSSCMSEAARRCNLTPPGLSDRIRALEDALGLQLFGRVGRSKLPLPSAAWLYSRAVRLLLAEEFVRQTANRSSPAVMRSLVVRLNSLYIGTRLCRTVIAAIRAAQLADDRCFIDLIFTRESSSATDRLLLPAAEATLEIALHFDAKRSPAGNWISFADDHQVVVMQRTGADREPGSRKELAIPSLPGNLRDSLAASLGEDRSRQIISIDAMNLQDQVRFKRLLNSHNVIMTGVLVPAWPTKLSALNVAGQGGKPVLRYKTVGHCSTLDVLSSKLRERFAADTRDGNEPPFVPLVSLREIEALNSVLNAGSMAGGARILKVTAPVVSGRLSRLEALLGTLVFKSATGTMPTDTAHRIGSLCASIERTFKDTLARTSKIAAEFKHAVRIGLPPIWSSDSRTARCMGVALSRFHEEAPECRVEAIEGSQDQLHSEVRRGSLNLAVVGQAGPHVGKLLIGDSEELSLITSSSLGYKPQNAKATIEEIQQLPLVLASDQLTMHRTFLAALEKVGVQLRPALRLGSVPLIVSVMRNSALATVLPLSVIRPEVEQGILEAFPLRHILPRRRLWIIYSTESGLNELERQLVAHVRDSFGAEAP